MAEFGTFLKSNVSCFTDKGQSMLYYKNKSDCFSRLISDGYFRTFVISGQAWYIYCDRLASEQLTKFSVTQRNFPLLIYKILNYALSAEIIFYVLKQIV